ncbi:RraA family protein [Jiangella rhizosphaerae]|uniref:Putative 4-hydroxy-4-methyl-2-oxoglutarate aldolase n=1 Tax=Jiangella rhizosphaerae TaxID=2293569 RepID=A0A418KGE0_9ACTN|nr:RraA family protein [Jiangella rhizosphaerae]RIQ10968.1 RraA family protein [Jiangella rhizosphaerae]
MFENLTTAHLADACLRAGVPVRCASLPPVVPGWRAAGRALPCVHVGSVDVFLEAYESAGPGDVLVVDNGGRGDEACVGDLAVLEARAAGLSGVVVWGLHRDTADIRAIGLPVFSLGALPTGPQRLDPRPADGGLVRAAVAGFEVTRSDAILADDDGVVVVPFDRAEELTALAAAIRDTERQQAELVRDGTTLRDQLRFGDYLARRRTEPELTFRQHLRSIGGAIEE